MKLARLTAIAVCSSLLFSPLVMAETVGDEEVKADKQTMVDAVNETYAHQASMRQLRQQVEELEQKKRIAELMHDCKKKGVTCYPTHSESLNMELVDEQAESGNVGRTTSQIGVPDITGLGGNLHGVQLEPGDEGYNPEFDPNYAAHYPVENTYDPALQVIEPVNSPFNAQPEVVVVEVSSVMPELLGIENNEAIFLVGGQELRATGGSYLPGKQWKVRDVSFDNVWMKGPDGTSTRVYINWR